jgi:hypothetical protein|tara:strand:- start:791 stop:964 length:174 start_codon:yes stop_codon:yes gene_type:complete
MNTQKEYTEHELRIIADALNALATKYWLDGRMERFALVDRLIDKNLGNIKKYLKGEE